MVDTFYEKTGDLMVRHSDYERLQSDLSDALTMASNQAETIKRLQAALKQAYIDGGCREDEAEEMVEAVGCETTKNTARDPDFYAPPLPRFYAESRCSQCGHPEEHIKRTGCPEKCGREPLTGEGRRYEQR